MKKIITVFLSTILLFSLVGCSKTAKVPIEDYKWSMATIQSVDNNGAFIAYDPDVAIDPEYSYAGQCTPMEMDCYVSDGKITIKDKTHNQVYYGTCELTENNRDSAIYEITILDEKGTAVTAITTHADGTEAPTLIISMGGYTLNFTKSNTEDDTQVGVIFQTTLPLKEAIQNQEFENKYYLQDYIDANFLDCKYFYVFDDAYNGEPKSNLTLDAENSHLYSANIKLPEDFWLIAYNIYETSDGKYYIDASLPMTLNTESTMYYSFGENPNTYSLQVTIAPGDVETIEEALQYTGMPAALKVLNYFSAGNVFIRKLHSPDETRINVNYSFDTTEDLTFVSIDSCYSTENFDFVAEFKSNTSFDYSNTIQSKGLTYEVYTKDDSEGRNVILITTYTAQNGDTCFAEITIDFRGSDRTLESVLEDISIVYKS